MRKPNISTSASTLSATLSPVAHSNFCTAPLTLKIWLPTSLQKPCPNEGNGPNGTRRHPWLASPLRRCVRGGERAHSRPLAPSAKRLYISRPRSMVPYVCIFLCVPFRCTRVSPLCSYVYHLLIQARSVSLFPVVVFLVS